MTSGNFIFIISSYCLISTKLCPLNLWEGERCFWCRSCRRSLLTALFLLDGFWPNLHRCITGRGKNSEWIFVTLTSFSRSHRHFEIFKFWPKKACLHPISRTKWQILAKLHVLQHWDGLKIWLDFGDLDLIFKVTILKRLWNFQILTKKSLSAPYLLNQMT